MSGAKFALSTRMGNICSELAPSRGEVLLEAALNGRSVWVRAMLLEQAKEGKESTIAVVNYKDSFGWTPLHRASLMGHGEIIDMLVSSGADINSKTNMGETPLYIAADNAHEECCLYLLRAGSSMQNIEGEKNTLVLTYLKPLLQRLEGEKMKRNGSVKTFDYDKEVMDEGVVEKSAISGKAKAKKTVSIANFNLNQLKESGPVPERLPIMGRSPSPQLTLQDLEIDISAKASQASVNIPKNQSHESETKDETSSSSTSSSATQTPVVPFSSRYGLDTVEGLLVAER